MNHETETAMPVASSARGVGLGRGGLVLLAALGAAGFAQAQSAAPAPSSDDTLTWKGITLYGIVDIGIQNQTHGAPISDYFVGGSAEVVQKNSNHAVTGVVPSSLSNSRIGLQGVEPIVGDWSGVFKLETFFNPQSGQISDALKSLVQNNGRPLGSFGGPWESEHQCGFERFGPDFHPVLCRGQLKDFRDNHLRPPKHGAGGRHRQVRP